jgi:peptidoglycan-N-acetylglucosamine deacetylase
VTPFPFWLISLLGLCAAFVCLPHQRGIIVLLTIPYLAVFLWGIFDLKSNFFIRAYVRHKGSKNRIAITFDDGPDPALTGDVLDLLARFGFKATFFVIGEKAKACPDLVRRAVSEGHIIGCHDLSHSVFSNFRMTSAMLRDIGEAQNIIGPLAGAKPLLYRPPVGLANPHLGNALARLSMHCIGWNRSVRDAGNRHGKNILSIGKIPVKKGDVILLHDCLPKPGYKIEVLRQFELLFEAIKSRGLEPVGVEDLFEIAAYDKSKLTVDS